MRVLRFALMTACLLMACNFTRIGEEVKPTVIPLATATVTLPAAEEPPLPSETAPSPISSPAPAHFVPATPQNVVLDFVARACEAQWSTNAAYLPCPAEAAEGGASIAPGTQAIAEGMLPVEAPLLVAQPGEAYPQGLGLFGRYPALQVFAGDTFRAVVGCQADSHCAMQFALAYYDAAGAYHTTDWEWAHRAGDGLREIAADLTPLTGQVVEFVLAVRLPEGSVGNRVLWVQPRIERDPQAPAPPPPPTLTATATPPPTAEVPGVISGMVDMSSAPPYLNDPVLGSSPVVVVFFNQDDGSYWWIHTSLTGHPYYQMTVPPGHYQVVAYAYGVGDQPYVTAAYTGQNPSCGQPLQLVEVAPNQHVENIVIADWNWLCGGDAYRPPKPEGVPLP